MTNDYIIEIILRARDEIAGTVAKAATELEGLKKAASNSSLKDLDADADRLSNTLRTKLQTELEKVRGQLNSTGSEADKFSRKFDNLTRSADQSNKALKGMDLDGVGRKLRRAEADAEKASSQLETLGKRTKQNQAEWDRWSGTLDKANKRIADHSSVLKKAEAEMGRLEKVTSDMNRVESQHQAALARTENSYRKQLDAVAKLRNARRQVAADPVRSRDFDFASMDREIDREERKVRELAAEVEALSLQKVTIGVDLDAGKFSTEVPGVEAEKAALGSDVHVNVDLDIAAAEAKLAAFEAQKKRAGSPPQDQGFLGWMRQVGQEADQSRSSIAAFDNAIRGMIVLAVIALSQQLLTVITALGGELIALASSAAMAGAALGGALTAGAAQALPVIGLLVAAFARFTSIIALVKQHQLEQQQQSYQGAKADKNAAGAVDALANAEDSLKSALEGLAVANQQLTLAQIGLTKARFDARRELQDLIIQEKEAELAARGAVLSQIQARVQLQQAIQSGSVLDVASAQIDRQSAALNVRKTEIDASRARQDLGFQRSGSPLRPDTGVADAERQLESARRAVVDAERAVESAKRGLDQAKLSSDVAANSALSAAGKFDYMLGKLDSSEKKLYQGVTTLYNTYKRVFRPITDIIVNSFTFAVNKVEQLFHDPKLIGSFTDLAQSISTNMNKWTSLFTSPAWVSFFSMMTKEAAKNLGPLTDGFIHLANAFRNIAIAASPVLRDMTKWIDEGAKAFQQWVGHGKGLTDFFKEGEKHLKAWGDLTISVVKLFLALIGTSSQEGLRSVRSLTGEVNKATSYINTHRAAVEKFFKGVGQVMGSIGKVVMALGAEIIKSFSPKSVEALSDILVRIVVPALGVAVRTFGQLLIVLDELTKNKFAETLLKLGVGFVIAKKVADPFIGVLQGLVVQARQAATLLAGFAAKLAGASTETIAAEGPMAALAGALEGVSIAALALPAAIAAAVAAFIFLSAKFGVLDDEANAIKKSFTGMIKPIVGPAKDLVRQLGDLGKALGIISGHGEGLGKVFQFVFVGIVKGLVIPQIKLFGNQLKMIGVAIGGMLQVVSGMVEIITGILTLNFGKIVDGAKKMSLGFTAPFRFMLKQVIGIVGDVLGVVGKLVGRLIGLFGKGADAIAGAFSHLGGRVVRSISSGWGSVWSWLRSLPGKFANAGSDVAEAFVRGVGKIPDLLGKALSKSGAIVTDLTESLMKFINDKTPFGDSISLGITSIHIPKLPEHFAGGGPVPGSGDQDTVPALLTPDEHVWTKQEVANAGGHSAMFALRRFFGGGGQGSRGLFASGGAVQQPVSGGQAQVPQQGDLSPSLQLLLGEISSFGSKAIDAWDNIWDTVQKRTSKGIDFLTGGFQDLQKSLISTTNRIESSVEASFDSMAKTAGGDVQSLVQVVFQGMSYVSDAVNRALVAFNVKKVDLHIPRPKAAGKAGGGFIGSQGERGSDDQLTWLGRGEAVLNWGHQHLVDPAMRAYHGFGLREMFQRTNVEHGVPAPGGYAAGGGDIFDGHPSNVASALVKIIRIMKKQFPGLGVSSTTDHSLTTSTGGISDHSTGHAVDLAGSIPYMLRAAAWVKSSGLYKQLKQGIHNPNLAVNAGKFVDGPGFYGVAWPQHIDHIHLAVYDALKGAFQGSMGVAKMTVKGTAGALKDLAQASLDKVTKAANAFVDSKSAIGIGLHGVSLKGVSGNVAEQFAEVAKRLRAPLRSVLALFEAGLAESGMRDLPGGDSTSQGPLQLLASTAAAMGVSPHNIAKVAELFLTRGFYGHGGAISLARGTDLPAHMIAQDVQGSAFSDGSNYLAQRNAALALMRKFGFNTKGFASGGVVGGHGGEGSPIPVLAHLGEWILNPRQQLRMATMLGTTVDKLKGMLGFTGGPTSFAGGGGPQKGASEGPSVGRGIPLNLVQSLTARFALLDTSLDKIAASVETYTTVMQTKLTKAAIAISNKGKVLGRRLQPEQILPLELDALNSELSKQLSEQGSIAKALKSAQAALKAARRSGDKKAIAIAQTAIIGYRKRLVDIGSQIAQQQQAILDKAEEIMAARVQSINDEADRALNGMDPSSGQFGTSIRQRILTAMGFSGQSNALVNDQIQILQNQQNSLRGALGTALAAGNEDLAHQIEGQIADLAGQISEATASLISNASQAIDTAAQHQQVAIDVGNRIADVQERYGNVAQAQTMRGQILQQQAGSIQNQLSQYQDLLTKALDQGFGPDVINPLADKIADLTEQLDENKASVYENTIAVRQATIDAIGSRQSFLGGVTDSLTGIVNTLGEITGQINTPQLVAIMQSAINQLIQTGTDLRQQLQTFVSQNSGALPGGVQGILNTLQGLHGQDFVAALQGVDMNSIIDSLGGPQSPLAQQFENLIQAIIDNEAALQQNTDQLQQVNQQNNIQGFTSTAWQWFRTAIFNGMGGLLPQYASGTPFFQQAASGGEVTADGPVGLHRGEIIVPAHFSNMLRRMVGAGAIAAGMSTGEIAGAPLSIDFATRRAATIQSEAASGIQAINSVNELAKLRQAIMDRTQTNILQVSKEEPTDDQYLLSRLAFTVKSPST